MKNNSIDFRDLYYSIYYSDVLDEDYKELMPYKPIFDGIKDNMYLYDHLKTDYRYDQYKESDRYMRELIKICKRTPIEEIKKIDDSVFEPIIFTNAPYDLLSLKQLSTILNPSYMATHYYKLYLKCLYSFFDYDYRSIVYNSNNRDRTIKLYNYQDLLLYTYDNNKVSDIFYHEKLYSFFFGYFYANNYPIEKVEEIMDKIINNIDYYNDLIDMNVNDINNKVYKYIESIIKDIDSSKKLIK